jgi:6-pyruvoyltetrahydropterin/6-carboxytetrahydropterin synthase
MYEIFKEFTFEAAHHLALNVAAGPPYAQLHGRSFRVEVYLRGEPTGIRTGCTISVR